MSLFLHPNCRLVWWYLKMGHFQHLPLFHEHSFGRCIISLGSMSSKTNYITDNYNSNIIKNGSTQFHCANVVYMCSVQFKYNKSSSSFHRIAEWIVLSTKKKRYTLHITKNKCQYSARFDVDLEFGMHIAHQG